jgi:hypothetical protein
MQPAEKPSLYERLGGVYSIATVVDEFNRPNHDRPAAEWQFPGGRSASSRPDCGIQVPGDRKGLLGGPAGHKNTQAGRWRSRMPTWRLPARSGKRS